MLLLVFFLITAEVENTAARGRVSTSVEMGREIATVMWNVRVYWSVAPITVERRVGYGTSRTTAVKRGAQMIVPAYQDRFKVVLVTNHE